MVLPGLLAIIVPTVVGYVGGAEVLGGLLAGVTSAGVLMAIFQSNAGGAWDNAKKMIEEGVEIDGEEYGKGSDVHKAAVVGDTVGDPFKDTSGPSLNILLKLMSVVALVIAPSIAIDMDDVPTADVTDKNTIEITVNQAEGEQPATVETAITIVEPKERQATDLAVNTEATDKIIQPTEITTNRLQ